MNGQFSSLEIEPEQKGIFAQARATFRRECRRTLAEKTVLLTEVQCRKLNHIARLLHASMTRVQSCLVQGCDEPQQITRPAWARRRQQQFYGMAMRARREGPRPEDSLLLRPTTVLQAEIGMRTDGLFFVTEVKGAERDEIERALYLQELLAVYAPEKHPFNSLHRCRSKVSATKSANREEILDLMRGLLLIDEIQPPPYLFSPVFWPEVRKFPGLRKYMPQTYRLRRGAGLPNLAGASWRIVRNVPGADNGVWFQGFSSDFETMFEKFMAKKRPCAVLQRCEPEEHVLVDTLGRGFSAIRLNVHFTATGLLTASAHAQPVATRGTHAGTMVLPVTVTNAYNITPNEDVEE